jgi:hypothetical protein
MSASLSILATVTDDRHNALLTFLARWEQFARLVAERTGLASVQPFSEDATVEQEIDCNVQSSCRA